MANLITLETLQAEAEKRGYTATVNTKNVIHVQKKQFAHVNSDFGNGTDFIERRQNHNYALLEAYYWLCGYDMEYGDDRRVGISRGMLHPDFKPNVRVAEVIEYYNMEQFQEELAAWVARVEQPTMGRK